jgi:hypothetical protein
MPDSRFATSRPTSHGRAAWPRRPRRAPVAAERDGVLPDGFFATTNLPTYVKGADGRWTMPREPRMDGVLVRDADGAWWVREGRRVKRGDEIVVGSAGGWQRGRARARDGLPGRGGRARRLPLHVAARSRARSRSTIAQIARMLVEEKRRGGYVLWVDGAGAGALARARQPRLVHPQRVRPGAARGERRRGARHRGGIGRHHARHDEQGDPTPTAGTRRTCGPSTPCAAPGRSRPPCKPAS